jgi:hypothetical protein
MSLKKFVVIPLIVGVLAFTIQLVDQHLLYSLMPVSNTGLCWIAFQAWAVYFLAGCNIKGGIKALIGYVVGITASILIMNMAGWFACLGEFFNVALAVGLVAFCLIFFERTTWFNLIPSMFIGAGAYFAFMSYVVAPSDPNAGYSICEFLNAAISELVYCVLGLTYGFITIALRTAYEKSLK